MADTFYRAAVVNGSRPPQVLIVRTVVDGDNEPEVGVFALSTAPFVAEELEAMAARYEAATLAESAAVLRVHAERLGAAIEAAKALADDIA